MQARPVSSPNIHAAIDGWQGKSPSADPPSGGKANPGSRRRTEIIGFCFRELGAVLSFWHPAELLRVQCRVREQQILQHAAADDRLLDDPRHVFELDAAVPDLLGIDDHGGSQFTLIETARLIGADQRSEVALLQFGLKAVAQRFAAIGIAAAAAMAGLAAIATDEDMAREFGHLFILDERNPRSHARLKASIKHYFEPAFPPLGAERVTGDPPWPPAGAVRINPGILEDSNASRYCLAAR